MIRNLAFGSIGTAIVLFSTVANGAPPDRAENLYGEWDIVGMVHRGVVQDPDRVKGGKIRIEKGKLFLRYREWTDPVESGFDIRLGTGSGEVDRRLTTGLHPGRYELKGGTLKIVFTSHADKPRPAGFDAEKDDSVTMYILTRPKQ